MGIKVHGLPLSTNTVRVVSALNELGLDYEMIPIDIRTGAHKHPSFLTLNPFGQIPVLEDGDIVLFESRAINKYLASNYGKSSGSDLLLSSGTRAEAAAVEVWQEVEAHHFGPPISAVVLELLVKPAMLGRPADAAVADAEAEKLGKVLDVYEARLANSKYLAGAEFSLADLNHMAYLGYLMQTRKADLVTSRPHVGAWWENISSRPAWKKTAASIKM